MSKLNEKTLRDKYFANEIFRVGELVEDLTTHEQMKILDRGSNYVTVATSNGIIKKWLNEVVDVTHEYEEPKTAPIVEATQTTPIVEAKVDADFELLESGQIKIFGYETKNFDHGLSEFMIEQFGEFDDLYSKHQIIKCLDLAIQENDNDYAYSLLQKVEGFYEKQNQTTPIIVEALKNDRERTRIAEILATVAGNKPATSNSATVTDAIKTFKTKYPLRKQWEVLWPFLKLAQSAGLPGALQNLPYSFDDSKPLSEEQIIDDLTIDIMEENIQLLVDDLVYEDIEETFSEDEFDEMLIEGLSIETRNKLGIKLRQHEPVLTIKRERAMAKSASSAVLMKRARRLAETMLKRRLFHKAPTNMSRQEKERFEAGASKRTALVARLAQKLVVKVRALQTTRMHHTNAPVSHTHDKATAAISTASQVGAS